MSQKTLQLNLLPNEYWWGGAVHHGTKMPFTQESTYSIDLNNHQTGNQVMPLFLSNQGRFIWCEDGYKICFTNGVITVESTSPLVFEDGHGSLSETFCYVKDNHFPPSGKYPEKKLFTHPQYNTWIELMYDQEEDKILDYAQKVIDEGYEPGILMIDDNWQEDYGVWEFSGTRFKDPKGMMDKLKGMGFLVMLWVCPFISPDSLTFRQLRNEGLLIKNKNGEIAIRPWWNGFSACLDFTNPKAVKWFDDKLDYLMTQYGVDGFKFDAGDPESYNANDQTHRKATPIQHAELYNILGEKYALNEFRAGYNTAGLGLAQRLSDKDHSWDDNGLNSLLPNGLTQGLLGFAFCCPDMIGGGQYLNFIDGSYHTDEELVVRYAQSSALFPMMQFSVAPWRVLNSDHANLCIDAANIHHHYGDYILNLAMESAKTGEPLMRLMEYVYPDCGYASITSQFMLGDKLLVAPVTNQGDTTKEITFPRGTWRGDDGTLVTGPVKLIVDAPLYRLPYYELVEISG